MTLGQNSGDSVNGEKSEAALLLREREAYFQVFANKRAETFAKDYRIPPSPQHTRSSKFYTSCHLHSHTDWVA